MKTLIIILAISISSSLLYCQSSIVFDAGTNLDVQAGADICSDNKTINGTYSGGGTFCDGPLPVELISFTSSISTKGRDVTLAWKTDKEINNAGFDIERAESNNQNLEFKKIGFIQGKGTVNTSLNYTFEDRKLQSGNYKYRLKQIDYNGNFIYYSLNNIVEIALPKKYDLSQNYPNPFNPFTKVDFELPVNEKVTIKIYDMIGREIATIVNEYKDAGYYTVIFDGSNHSSGVYFYRLISGKYSGIKRMLMIK